MAHDPYPYDGAPTAMARVPTLQAPFPEIPMRSIALSPARLAALAPALVLAVLALGACTIEHSDDDRPPRLVSVNGDGSVVAAPDRATVMLSIAARNKDLAKAQAEADEVVARVMAVAKDLGIDKDKVQTTSIQIQPEFDWNSGKRVLLGYLVQRTSTIELEDLSKLGDLMEKALATGVNEVSPPMLSSSKRKDLERQALRAAGEDAKRNAEAIADSLGAEVGTLYAASGQGGGNQPQPMMMRNAAMESMKADVSETYSAGEIRITATVNAQFELE